jgi:DNA-binding HxlR family transcriptional regulator
MSQWRKTGKAYSMSTHEDTVIQRMVLPRAETNDLAVAIARTLHLVSGKWKIHILSQLFVAPMRYNELNRLLPQLSPKVLTQQLHALERDALIYRAYHGVPGKRVNYTITARGARLWNSLALFKISAEDFSRPAALDANHDSELTRNLGSARDNRSDGAEPIFASTTCAKPRNQFRDSAYIRQCQ